MQLYIVILIYNNIMFNKCLIEFLSERYYRTFLIRELRIPRTLSFLRFSDSNVKNKLLKLFSTGGGVTITLNRALNFRKQLFALRPISIYIKINFWARYVAFSQIKNLVAKNERSLARSHVRSLASRDTMWNELVPGLYNIGKLHPRLRNRGR